MIGRLAAHMRALEEADKQRKAQLEHELEVRGLSPLRVPKVHIIGLGVMVLATLAVGWIGGAA